MDSRLVYCFQSNGSCFYHAWQRASWWLEMVCKSSCPPFSPLFLFLPLCEFVENNARKNWDWNPVVPAMNKPGFRILPTANCSFEAPTLHENGFSQPRSTEQLSQINSGHWTNRIKQSDKEGAVRNSFSSFSKLSFSSLGPGLTQGEIFAWLMEWQLNSRKDDDKSWDLGPNADKNRIWLACLMFGQGASLMFQVIAWFFSQNFFEEISELEWIVIRIGYFPDHFHQNWCIQCIPPIFQGRSKFWVASPYALASWCHGSKACWSAWARCFRTKYATISWLPMVCWILRLSRPEKSNMAKWSRIHGQGMEFSEVTGVHLNHPF